MNWGWFIFWAALIAFLSFYAGAILERRKLEQRVNPHCVCQMMWCDSEEKR